MTVRGRYVGLCRLQKQDRFMGYRQDYYDGPIHCYGIWFWHLYVLP